MIFEKGKKQQKYHSPEVSVHLLSGESSNKSNHIKVLGKCQAIKPHNSPLN